MAPLSSPRRKRSSREMSPRDAAPSQETRLGRISPVADAEGLTTHPTPKSRPLREGSGRGMSPSSLVRIDMETEDSPSSIAISESTGTPLLSTAIQGDTEFVAAARKALREENHGFARVCAVSSICGVLCVIPIMLIILVRLPGAGQADWPHAATPPPERAFGVSKQFGWSGTTNPRATDMPSTQPHTLQWVVGHSPGVIVWKEKNRSSATLSIKQHGEVLVGRLEGDWLALTCEEGFIELYFGKLALLSPLEGTFSRIQEGSCIERGLFPVINARECQAAAEALKLSNLNDGGIQHAEPPWSSKSTAGCYIHEGTEVWLNLDPASASNGAMSDREPICVRPADSCPHVDNTTSTTTMAETFFPITTVATSSTKTETKTATATMTTTTSTTRVRLSLYCFMVQMGPSSEQDLMKSQFDEKVSIFSCAEWAVFTERPVELWKGGLKTYAIHGPQAKQGPVPGHPEWKMTLNVGIFMRAWSKIAELGHYRNHDWIVKVDADAVFLPHRLRLNLAYNIHQWDITPEDSVYFRNCRMFNSLQGPIEVFSKGAVERLVQNKDRCMKYVVPSADKIGEDWFVKLCLDMLHVRAISNWDLLSDGKCGQWQTPELCAKRHNIVAFHPFKDSQGYFQCVRQAG